VSDKPDQLEQIRFRCRECGHQWEGAPARVVEQPATPWHPWDYFAPCPECGEEAAQAAWERNLLKAHAHATGPKTDDGRARSLENLEGGRQSQVSRFNAMKHGMFARTATYFPARPGKYPACDGCEYLNNGCGTEHKACMKRAELMMQYQIATDTGDVSLLKQLQGGNQAALQGMINDMILSIAQDGGPRQIVPVWTKDNETGRIDLVEFFDKATGEHRTLNEIKAHPLLKHLIDFIQKNNMTLEDMGMTAKQQGEEATLRGQLADQNAARETVLGFQKRTAKSVEGLKDLIGRSHKSHEPRVIEGNSEDG